MLLHLVIQPGETCTVIAPACQLKSLMAQALGAYLAVLNAYTLADLVENRTKLAALLRMEAQAA